MDIKEVVNKKEYDFLRNDEHLKDRMLFATFGGSYAYGTNIETSDIDIRGVALNSKSDILGTSNFEQKIDNATDTTIYSFKKIIPLLVNCNPNIIEILGCKKEDYIVYNNIAYELLNNQKMFLSKRCVNSFCGYANAQLNRLMNALARDSDDKDELEEHVLRSMESQMFSFNGRYASFRNSSFKLYLDTAQNIETRDDGITKEIYADINLNHYPLSEYNSIMNELSNVSRVYNKCGKRNHKKDNEHLNKHAMHLIRLYLMGIDILEKEEIVTYREKDHDLLMSIRNGKFQNEDSSYKEEFFELLDSLKKRIDYAEKNTSLPNKPDMNKIEELVISVNEKSILI